MIVPLPSIPAKIFLSKTHAEQTIRHEKQCLAALDSCDSSVEASGNLMNSETLAVTITLGEADEVMLSLEGAESEDRFAEEFPKRRDKVTP